MASLVHEGLPDLKALKTHVEQHLPQYAQPVFLRVSRETDTTSTFKFKKTNLVKADAASGSYKKISPEIYKKICSGEIRL